MKTVSVDNAVLALYLFWSAEKEVWRGVSSMLFCGGGLSVWGFWGFLWFFFFSFLGHLEESILQISFVGNRWSHPKVSPLHLEVFWKNQEDGKGREERRKWCLLKPQHWISQKLDLGCVWHWPKSWHCAKPSLTLLWECSVKSYRLSWDVLLSWSSSVMKTIMLIVTKPDRQWKWLGRVLILAPLIVLYKVMQVQLEMLKKNLPQNSFQLNDCVCLLRNESARLMLLPYLRA